MVFALIFGIILLTYVVFHAFAYFSIARFFSISDPAAKKMSLAIFVLFGVGYFASTFLYHYNDNYFTGKLYLISGIWVGLLINLDMFLLLAWAVVLMARLSVFRIDQKLLVSLAIVGSLVFSVYGIWNAFNPVVKNIAVSMANLPAGWSGKKIVHISDAHLGSINGVGYLKAVVGKINALQPDVIAITGDLFDQTDGNLDVFSDLLGELRAKNEIFYVTGNHETYLGKEKAIAVIEKAGIVPLRDEMRLVEGLQFVGIDYPDRMDVKNVSQIIGGLDDYDAQKPSVLLWHAPSQVEEIKDAGISLQLSGHTHKGQIFPFGFITSLVFDGYDYGLKNEANFSIYTTSGVGTWGPAMRTQKRCEIVEIILK